MTYDTAVAIFAKFPESGRVKTRLTEAEIPGWGSISPEQASQLYRAFLQDYARRFSAKELLLDAFFCVRPGTDVQSFQKELCGPELGVVEEPTFRGHRATSIGEAMSFTIKHFLSSGYKKVIILGSDLPHLPKQVLSEAQHLLGEHPLVLGNDGGGCYLVGASSPPSVLEDSSVVWSKGQDFHMLCKLQKEQGLSVGILSEIWADIDRAEDLVSLCEDLRTDPLLSQRIRSTKKILEKWGLFSR